MKKLALLLLLTAPAFGQGLFYSLPQPLPNATLYVCNTPATGTPCSNQATIYSNSVLSSPIVQPVQLGTTGALGFYIAAGQYTIQVLQPYNLVFSISLGGSGGGGNTTSTSLVSGSIPKASGANSIVNGYTVQGTDSSLISSGTVSGTGSALCTDANGGATTIGCPAGGAGFPVTTPQTVNVGGAITPAPSVNQGAENISSGSWYGTGGSGVFAYPPTLTGALTGGNLSSGTNIYVQITITNSVGESLPSVEELIMLNASTNCASGNACTITVTAPTLLTGQTYTVYDGGKGAELQQTASANCVHLASGVNCVIGTLGTGAAPPTTNGTVPVLPGSVYASECPPGQNPVLYAQDDVNPTFHTLADINTRVSFSGESHTGQFEFCRPVIFNFGGHQPSSDVFQGTPMAGNGALLIYDQPIPGNVVTTVASQIQETIPTSDATNYTGQILGNYSEIDFGGTGNLGGSSTPGQVAAGGLRGVVSYTVTAASPGSPGLMAGVSGTTFRESAATNGCGHVICFVGGYFTVFNYATANNTSGSEYVAVLAQPLDGGQVDSTGQGYAVYAQVPPPNNFWTRNDIPSNVGLWADDYGDQGAGGNGGSFDMVLASGGAGSGRNLIGGNIIAEQSINLGGSISTTQVGTPGTPVITQGGTGASTAYSYKVVAVDGAGNTTPASAVGSTSSGAATLNATNYNIVTWTCSAANAASYYNIYRTASSGSPSSTGKINSTPYYTTTVNNGIGCQFKDTGLAGDSSTPPTVNTTGGGIFAGPVQGTTVNATTGFQVGGTAPNAHCLVGNGTNYVDSSTCGGTGAPGGVTIVKKTATYAGASGDFSGTSTAPSQIIFTLTAISQTYTLLSTAPATGSCVIVENSLASAPFILGIITGGSTTLDGTAYTAAAGSLALAPGDSSEYCSDGTNYFTQSGKAGSYATQAGFWSAYSGMGENIPNVTYTAASPVVSANQVFVNQITLSMPITINKMVANVGATASETIGFGFYDTSGNLLGSQTMSGSVLGIISTTWGTPLTLPRGTYYFAQTDSGTTATMYFGALVTSAPNVAGMINTNRNRSGLCANASASGVLPATCGAISTGTTRSPMLVWFEN